MFTADRSDGAETRQLGLINQLVRFVIIGGGCAVIDSGTYALLLSIGWPLWLSKTMSFVLGTTSSYFINRTFTFQKRESDNAGRKALAFASVYLATLLVNVGTNQVVRVWLPVLAITQDSGVQVAIAWVVAQGVSTLLNFVMLRWFVFR